jgi:hypothetical protein
MADFDSLSLSDQAARVVIDSAMRIADGEARSTAASHPDLRVLNGGGRVGGQRAPGDWHWRHHDLRPGRLHTRGTTGRAHAPSSLGLSAFIGHGAHEGPEWGHPEKVAHWAIWSGLPQIASIYADIAESSVSANNGPTLRYSITSSARRGIDVDAERLGVLRLMANFEFRRLLDRTP